MVWVWPPQLSEKKRVLSDATKEKVSCPRGHQKPLQRAGRGEVAPEGTRGRRVLGSTRPAGLRSRNCPRDLPPPHEGPELPSGDVGAPPLTEGGPRPGPGHLMKFPVVKLQE